jgi:hypothetical protein
MGIGRYFIVLGTDHRLQGAEKRLEPPNINDPSYSALVRDTVSFHSVDFVFEEASMKGPTTAKRIADELNIPYCDVDLDEKTRGEAGMEGSTGQIIAPEYLTKNDRPEHGSVRSHRISAQMQREEYWVSGLWLYALVKHGHPSRRLWVLRDGMVLPSVAGANSINYARRGCGRHHRKTSSGD